MRGLTAKELEILEDCAPPVDDDEICEEEDLADWTEYRPICEKLEARGLLRLQWFQTSDGAFDREFYVRTVLGVLAVSLQRALNAGNMVA